MKKMDLCSKFIANKYLINLYSWLICYLAQMNALIGPKLDQETILLIAKEWGPPVYDLDTWVSDGGH